MTATTVPDLATWADFCRPLVQISASRVRRSAGGVRAHALLDQLPALLELAVGEPVGGRLEPEAGLDAVEVDLDRVVVDAELRAQALTVTLREQHGDVGDL